jgi:hypothetical protein
MNNRDILGEISKYMNTKGKGSLASIGPHTLHLMPGLNDFEKLWFEIFNRGLIGGESIWIQVGRSYIIFHGYHKHKKLTAEIGRGTDENTEQLMSLFESVLKKHRIKTTRSRQIDYTLTLNKDSELEIAFAELFVRCYNTFRERLVVYLTMKNENGTIPFPVRDFMDVLKAVASMPKYSVSLTSPAPATAPSNSTVIAESRPPRTSPNTQRRRIINEDDSIPTSTAQSLLKHGNLDEVVRIRRETEYLPKLAKAGPTPHLGGKRQQKNAKK